MKKVLSIIALLLVGMMASAQDLPDMDSVIAIVKEKGVYEQKHVVTVDGASASKLYSRAMEALSEWVGPEGRSKAGLDYCDKEEGIVTYKGVCYNGNRKFLTATTDIYTDFVLKVRCKDGRAQVTVTVPSMYMILPNGDKRTYSIRDVVNQMEESKKKKGKKKDDQVSMREVVAILLNSMETALQKADDEDF
jgi:hypothetical protein